MVIYLIESDLHKAAFSDPEEAASIAVKLVEADLKGKKQRQIFSDYGSMTVINVEAFDVNAVAAYIEAMKVNRKVILQITCPKEAISKTIAINKIILV